MDPQQPEPSSPHTARPDGPAAAAPAPSVPEPTPGPETPTIISEPALPTMQDLRAVSADLDEIDEVLERLDADPVADLEPEPVPGGDPEPPR